jgi:hypothetical protein
LRRTSAEVAVWDLSAGVLGGWLIDTTQPSGVGSIDEALVWTDGASAQ